MILKTRLHTKILKIYADGKGVNELEGQRLAYLASQVPENGVIVEIGSYKGQSAAYLGAGSKRKVNLFLVDLWDRNKLDSVSKTNQYAVAGENHYKTAIKRLTILGLMHKITTVKGLSSDVAKDWVLPIDLLFIDGDHSYRGISSDYKAWYPFVKKGGVIAFHDYCPRWTGVTRLIDEKVSKELQFLGLYDRVWSGKK